MKNLKLVILLVLSPLTFFAQQLTGLWTGTLSNDSTSIRQDQSFEIALTEYKGKVYGYSRSTFIVNDTLYYIVKRVKGTIEDGICEVKDDEIISCNFLKKIGKGVKVVHTFRLNQNDSTWQLDGNWKTTQTKKYYSLTGKSDLGEEKDIDNSKIFPHLEELNLAKDVPFYVTAKKAKDETIARQLADRKRTSILTEQQTGVNNTDLALGKPTAAVKTKTVAVDNEVVTLDERANQTAINPEKQTGVTNAGSTANISSTAVVKTKTVAVDNEVVTLDERANQTTINPEKQAGVSNAGLAANNPAATVKTKTVAVNNELKSIDKPTQPNNPSEQQLASNKPVSNPAKPNNNTFANTVPSNQAKLSQPVSTVAKQPAVDKPVASVSKPAGHPTGAVASPATGKTEEKTVQPLASKPADLAKNTIPDPNIILKNVADNPSGAASLVNERKTDAQQTVIFKADSVVIAVYDNGEIDGDTVSVLLNGQVVMAKQGLKAAAAKKTLYLPSGNDEEFSLVLYAENLGKYPPNTGLLVIYDGDDRHYVRFSADLQQNAGVVLKRKK